MKLIIKITLVLFGLVAFCFLMGLVFLLLTRFVHQIIAAIMVASASLLIGRYVLPEILFKVCNNDIFKFKKPKQ